MLPTGGSQYEGITTEMGFSTVSDFGIYSEDELVHEGFKRVHARRIKLAEARGTVEVEPASPVDSSGASAIELLECALGNAHTEYTGKLDELGLTRRGEFSLFAEEELVGLLGFKKVHARRIAQKVSE